MNTIGWMIAGSLFFAVLAAAFSYIKAECFFYKKDQNDELTVRVRALFGLVKYELHIPEIHYTGLAVKLRKHKSFQGFVKPASKQAESSAAADPMSNEEIAPHDVLHYWDQIQRMIRAARNLKSWSRLVLKRIEIMSWNWQTSAGVQDAMQTAVISGSIWTIKTVITGAVSSSTLFTCKPRLDVQPNFSHPSFTTSFECIAQIRLGNAIVAGIELLIRILKTKGGIKAWQNILFKA